MTEETMPWKNCEGCGNRYLRRCPICKTKYESKSLKQAPTPLEKPSGQDLASGMDHEDAEVIDE